LENFASASSTNSSKNENNAPTATTMPMKLIQFLKTEEWFAVDGLFSVFMARCKDKKPAAVRLCKCHRPAHSLFRGRDEIRPATGSVYFFKVWT
jgi:hypothetical protein